MTYYIFLEDGKINGAGQCPILNEEIENLEVTEDVYNAFVENPDKYIYLDGKIIENPNYETEQAELRKKQFNTEFFNTSLGFVKRKVTMKDGSVKDFLSDILPLLQEGVPIITYNEPDFKTQDLPTQNVSVIVTEQFIKECKQQVLNDFYGAENEEK